MSIIIGVLNVLSSNSSNAVSTFVSITSNKSKPSSVVKSTASVISSPMLVQVPNWAQGVITTDCDPAVVIDNWTLSTSGPLCILS